MTYTTKAELGVCTVNSESTSTRKTSLDKTRAGKLRAQKQRYREKTFWVIPLLT